MFQRLKMSFLGNCGEVVARCLHYFVTLSDKEKE